MSHRHGGRETKTHTQKKREVGIASTQTHRVRHAKNKDSHRDMQTDAQSHRHGGGETKILTENNFRHANTQSQTHKDRLRNMQSDAQLHGHGGRETKTQRQTQRDANRH